VTGKLVLENLKHKPMRSLLSILLIGVPVTLILCLVGISHGFLEDTQKRARGIGADIVVRPKGTTLLTMTGWPMLEEMVTLVARQPHVKLAIGVVNKPIENVTLGATGVNLAAFAAMNGGFEYDEKPSFSGDRDILVDRIYADQNKLYIGGPVTLLNQQWRVAGIFKGGKLARIVFPIKVLQKAIGAEDHVSQIYIKLDDPANTNAVIASLKQLLPEYPVISMPELISLYNINSIPALSAFITVIMGIGVVIGFAVVCLSMYMSVLQRTREIGILKSLGSSNGFILGIILVEALLLGVGGTIVGIIFSVGAWWLIATLIPASFPMVIVVSWWPIAGAITILGAVLGAVYPGLNAARHDPIEALAYE
jgi:putative ABC transport system permease protein